MVTPKALPFTSGGILIIAWAVVLLGLATIAVALRFWSRVLTKISAGLDDWLVLASLITYYCIVVLAILATKYGGFVQLQLQRPAYLPLAHFRVDLTRVLTLDLLVGYEEAVVLEKAPQNLNYLLLILFAYTWAYSVSSQLIKLTVVAFYWRIFPTKFIRTGCVTISSVSISFMVSMMFVNGLQCRPIAYYWTQVGDATCINLTAYYFVVSVINFIIDLCTLTLPLREVSRLHAPFWRRVGICGIFFLGSIVVVASLVRLVLMRQFQLNGFSNMSWHLVPGWVMTLIEVAVGIIGACLPTLVPVYRKLRYGSIDARDTSKGKHTPYQPGRHSRTAVQSLSLGGQVSVGETKPSHERLFTYDRTGSFDSFEMLGGPPNNSDPEQQADRISVSGYHDAEQEVRILGSSLTSLEDERPSDAAHGIYVRHEVIWTESINPNGTHDWREGGTTLEHV